jgi:hypothetical protein
VIQANGQREFARVVCAPAASRSATANGSNAAFLKAGGTAEQFRDGIQRAVDKGWMVRHESGTYVKFADAGAALFA